MRETLLRVSRREKGASIQQFQEGMGLMARWLVAGLFGLLMAGLLPGVASAGGCSNEQFRTGPSGNLPDCRAYEMVSPVDKNDGGIGGGPGTASTWESSLDGNRMAYVSSQAFADAPTGANVTQLYVASRAAGGWSSHALSPPQAPGAFFPNQFIEAFSSDLSQAVLLDGGGASSVFGQDDPPLVNGEPPENPNLFVGDNSASRPYRLVDVTPQGTAPSFAFFMGSSLDLQHVFFREKAQLTADAPGESENLYEWTDGVVSLVSILPGGAALVGSTLAPFVSEDGSRIVFSNSGSKLYLREDGATVQIDATQGPGPGGAGVFQVASGDGSRVFFTDDASNGLTNDTVPGSGKNLYEYNGASGGLTDLTPGAHVEVQGHVFGAGRDGSYVYFVADSGLAAGATAGQPNLYVWHEGAMTFIATLNAADQLDWNPSGGSLLPVSVAPDGRHLVFGSVASLTGYDNTDVNNGVADTELYLYDAVGHQLNCISCNPSGARPEGPSQIGRSDPTLSIKLEKLEDSLSRSAHYRQRYLSDDGSRVFFDSFDMLVPQDTNGKMDVYEYEDGQVHLISGGTSDTDSLFTDASPSGGDVFFTTAQQLVGQDQDSRVDLYDARVNGGFPFAQPVSCAGEGCRSAPAGPPVLGVPGSATFSGVGNLVPATSVRVVKPKPKAKKQKAKAKKRRRRARKRARGARHGVGHSIGKRG
jgi:hypothetical protein